MNIRLAIEEDYDAVVSLMQQLNPDDPALNEPRGRQLYSEILATQGLLIFIVDIEGLPVASCYLNIIPNLTRSGQPYALIENVVTDVNYRKQGMGKFLLTEVLSEAFRRNCYKVMLLTGRDSDVHTFYESCGFDKHSKVAFIKRSPR